MISDMPVCYIPAYHKESRQKLIQIKFQPLFLKRVRRWVAERQAVAPDPVKDLLFPEMD